MSIKINIEKILSYIKLHNILSQLHAKHFGLKSNSVITEEIQTIHRILNISDPITFQTHISYFFLIIAARVAAISGKLVPAAIIVAQIAHSDTHITVATYTAEATITSDDIINNPILAIILVMLSNIQFSCSFLLCFFLLNIETQNKIRITHINIIEYVDNQNSMLNQFSVLIFIIDRIKIHANKYKKFLISGSSIVPELQASSIGSFLIQRYQLYPNNKAKHIAHSRHKTFWSRRNTNNRHEIRNKKNQSLYTSFFCITIGTNIALNHSINHRLNIFEPTIFPTDNDPLQFIADIADKNNSGAEVHIAKIVNHMNNGDSLKILATLTLEFINLSAENQSKNNHNINIIIARIIILIYK